MGARRFRVLFAAVLLLVAAGTATAGIRSAERAATAGRHSAVRTRTPLPVETVAAVMGGTHGSDRSATPDPWRIFGLAVVTLGAVTLASRRHASADVAVNASVRPLRRSVGLRAPPIRLQFA